MKFPDRWAEQMLRRYKKVFKFIIVGGSATVVHALVYSGLIALLGTEPQAANFVGYLCAVSVTFLGNSFWTFSADPTRQRFVRFISVSLSGFLMNAAAVQVTTRQLGLAPYWALVVIIGVTPWITYALASRWVFVTPQKVEDDNIQSWYKPVWQLALGWLIVDLIFFRHNYFSGFDQIFGDLGDPRIVLTLLEHWYSWWHGLTTWRSPSFFWPESGVLGYTDAYFLFSMPYTLFRELGLDMYLSMEFSYRVMKLAGYLGMVWLLSSILLVPTTYAVAGGMLFSILNGLYWHSIHMQLSAVAIVPVLLGIILLWLKENFSLKHSVLFTLILASLYMTSFYVAWYTTLSVLVLILMGVILGAVKLNYAFLKSSILSLGAFGIFLLPFFYLYVPILQEKKGHAFDGVLKNALYPSEFFRVGPDNLIWGWLEPLFFLEKYNFPQGLYTYIPNYERIAGFTPCLGIVFFVVSLRLIYVGVRSRSLDGYALYPLLLSLVGLFFIFISMRYGDVWPWKLVYAWIPGGSAMRVPSRVLLFVSAFLVPVVMYGIWRFSRISKLLGITLIVFLLVEQLNVGPVNQISRSEELDRLSYPAPPAGCKAFYVSRGSGVETGFSLLDNFYTPNIDAMLLSAVWKVPTLNGISTWFPSGWGLLHPGSADYERAAQKWSRFHGLESENICSLDMRKGTWEFPAFAYSPVPEIGTQSVKTASGEHGRLILTQGWSDPEGWGVWSAADKLGLRFEVVEPTQSIELLFQAYRANERPLKLTIKLNGCYVVQDLRVDKSQPQWYKLKPDEPLEGIVKIEILVDSPRSPSEWGGADTRKLGIGLMEVSAKAVK